MRNIFLGLAAVAAVASTPALAATATNTMPVSVNVINSCTVAATPMAFGAPVAIGGVNIDTTSTISLACTNGATYDVALDLGANASAGQRFLSNGAATPVTIPYNVFRDAGRSLAWGSTSGTNTSAGTAGTSGLVVLTAFGRIPSTATSVGAGSYTDTVTVTVTF